MLLLLRKIRRKLISTNNKFITYLLYAIGEIFLVVAGILIAVQIDEWNEDRKLRDQEVNYLTRLIDENEQDLESFSLLLKNSIYALQSIESLCYALNDNSSSDSLILAEIEHYMTYGSIVPTFTASRSTFDDLSNTGNLKVITDEKLRNKIVQHYAGIQKVQERLNIDSDWALALDMPFYYQMDGMKFVPSTAHLFPNQTQEQLANELRKNKLRYINNAAVGHWVDQDAIDLLNKLIAETNDLIRVMKRKTNNAESTLPDPLAAGWKGQNICAVLEDNENLRVLKCTFPPGTGHERHYHDPHVGYTIAGGFFQITDTTGTREVHVKPGGIFSSDGITWHEVMNIGETTGEFLIIEYK